MKLPIEALKILRQNIKKIKDIVNEECILSVLVFGSVTKGEYIKDVSDVDYIIVFRNECNSESLNSIRKMLTEQIVNFDQTFGRRLELAIGMKVSGFVTSLSKLREKDFSGIFNTNKFLSRFAPKSLVLKSIYLTSKVYYGLDLRYLLNPNKIKMCDIFKSWIVTVVIFTFALLNLKKNDRWKTYTRESLKWSILNCHTFAFEFDLGLRNNLSNLSKCYWEYELVKKSLNLNLKRGMLLFLFLALNRLHAKAFLIRIKRYTLSHIINF